MLDPTLRHSSSEAMIAAPRKSRATGSGRAKPWARPKPGEYWNPLASAAADPSALGGQLQEQMQKQYPPERPGQIAAATGSANKRL